MAQTMQTQVKPETEDAFRGVAQADASVIETLFAMQLHNLENSRLDARSYSLCKIAALIALDAPPASFLAQVAFALDSGASADDILGVLIAVAPQVGLVKVVSAAPELMLALGLALPEDA